MVTQKALAITLFLLSPVVLADNLSVEEKRIPKAEGKLTQVTNQFDSLIKDFKQKYALADSSKRSTIAQNHAQKLWQRARTSLQSENSNYDDRSLYWARLKLSKAAKLLSKTDETILWEIERASRGQSDINFSSEATRKILITGFDPFFLDRNIGQSNPSGLAALLLDGKIIQVNDEIIQIESAIFPVRFIDFDHGEVERFLKPYLKNNAIDMLITISMGRDTFDLERFPALRRSAQAPGNLNVFTGASKNKPLIPMLGKTKLDGPEFVEFSLPVKAMMQIQEPFKVNDRHTVTTTEKTFDPKTLAELKGKTSVAGSGGGYLSNEISYRSINLGNKLKTKVKIGHLHTPRIQGFEPKVEKQIVEQIKKIIVVGAKSLN